jgi:hypothetical protein
MARTTDPIAALEARRSTIQQVEEAAGGLYIVSCKFDVTSAGEGVFAVEFAVRFTEEPTTSISHHMASNQRLIPGNFPRITHGVANWHMGLRQPSALPFYSGATVYYSGTGPNSLHYTVHARFEGHAIRTEAGLV